MFHRRQFLKTCVAAAAGTIAAPAFGGSLLNTRAKVERVGLQLWSIAKVLEKDFAGTLKMLSRIGYKELELFGPYPFSTQKDKDSWNAISPRLGFSRTGYFNHSPEELKKILDGEGLSTPAMHVGLDTLRNSLSQTAEAAHILGQQYAGIASIPEAERKTLDDYKRMADEFNVIGEKAKALDIRFYYHNHGYGLKEMNGKIPFDIILERTDPSLVFFEMDIFWTTAGGADPLTYLDKHPGRFKLMHVKDMKKKVQFSGDGGNPQQWIELFPYITDAGSGVLDLKTIMARASKSGLEHFILENDVITNPGESLKKGYQFVSSVDLQA